MIYLSGPMTGLPDYNIPTFDSLERFLASMGHQVFSPATMAKASKASLPRAAYMRADIVALLKCDTIIMLPGWEVSGGACLEWKIAKEIGISTFQAKPLPSGSWELVV